MVTDARRATKSSCEIKAPSLQLKRNIGFFTVEKIQFSENDLIFDGTVMCLSILNILTEKAN